MNFQERTELINSDTSMRWTRLTMVKPSFQPTRPHSIEHTVHHPPHEMLPVLEQSLIQTLQSSNTPQDGLLQFTRILGEAFQVDSCMIGLIGQDQTVIHSTCWYAGGSSAWLSPSPDVLDILSHLVTTSVTITPVPISIADIHASKTIETLQPESKAILSLQQPRNCPPIRAVLAIQTMAYGQVNGLIVLTRSQPHDWTEQETHFVQAVPSSVSIAISQVQLHQQVTQQTRYQALISQLTTAVRGSGDIDQIFQLAIAGLVSTLPITRGFVLLFKYSNPLYKKRSSDPAPKAKVTVECQYPLTCDPLLADEFKESLNAETSSGTWLKQSFWLSECGFCQHLFSQDASPVAIPSSAATLEVDETTLASATSPIFDLATMPSLLLVPLENQGTVLGCLVLQSNRPHQWQPGELSVTTLMAAQLSTAIIQTRTLRQVQSLVEERTSQLQRSLDVQAKLYEKTRQQVDQLRRLNRIMEEFLSTMSHELLTPLTSMTLAIRMLRQAKLSPDQQNRYLDILERQCAQETNLINDLLALQQLESGATVTRFQPLDVRYPIRDIAQILDETCAKKRLTLDLDLPPRALHIHTDLDSLTRILTELLTNAGKYADPDTTIRLKVFYQIKEQVGQIVIQLSNVGAGITAEEMPYIFDKFRRGQGVTQQAIPGTGLGLALVKGLVGHLNGTIDASSIPLDDSSSWETCFTLMLPQSPD